MTEAKSWNHACVVATIAMIALLALCAVFEFDTDGRGDRPIMYMSAHFAGMAICVILFVSVFLDRRVSKSTFYFMCIILTEFLCLLIEFVYWDLKNTGTNDLFFEVRGYLVNLFLPLVLYMFGYYEKSILKMPDEVYRNIKIHLDAFIILEIVFLATNYFTDAMFELDGHSYIYNDLWALLFVPPFCMITICMITALRYSPDARHKVVILIYILIPVAVVIARLPKYSSSITFLAMLMSLIFMYGEIYLNRGMNIVKNEAAMVDQKVALMMTRIEPELLGETLDSIASVEGTPEDTRKAISQFKKYLSENIDTITQKTPIPITKELEHVHTYVDLEKLRFKEKLNIVFDIRDTDFRIPAMTLQMLVENAIKHGITQRECGGTVTITMEESDDSHRIVVRDDGVGFDVNAPRDESRSHIGLANLTDRLNKMVDGRLVIESEVGKGTVATVTIPKRK